jgi:membrane associated rhomboid family serine protease
MIIYLIIIITALVSILSFNDRSLLDKLRFNAFDIKHNREGWRFFTYALVHADWIHLLVNMYVLYSFGDIVLQILGYHFGYKATVYFLLLYVGGILFATLFDFGKYKEDFSYNAVGASGAVSAVVFASILLYPQGTIYFFFIPFPIPSVIFGILYLVYSAYMSKKGKDNIGHSAHFWGAVFGIVFTIALKPVFATKFLDYILSFL